MSVSHAAAFSIDGENLRKLETIYHKFRTEPGSTIPILQDMQEAFGYVPEDAVNWMADMLGEPRSKFFGVATFYAQFHMHPRGKNIVTVCCGTACHVKGSEKLLFRAQTEIGLPDGQTTTDDLNFTLEKVACLGTCSMAPAVLINKKMHGGVKADALAKEIKHMKKG